MEVYKLELRAGRRTFLIWTICCGALMVLYLVLFPMMKEMDLSGMIQQMAQSMPKGFLEMFGFSMNNDFSTLPRYLGMVMAEMNIALVIYGACLGSMTLAKEESEGTIEYLYSMPVSRREIYLEKLLAVVSYFALFIVIQFLVCLVSALTVADVGGETVSIMAKIFVGSFFSGMVYLALGYLVSVLLGNARQAMALTVGFVFVSLIIGSMAGLTEQVDWLRYFSPLKYGEAAAIVQSGFNSQYVAIGLGVIVVSLAASLVVYDKKDFRI